MWLGLYRLSILGCNTCKSGKDYYLDLRQKADTDGRHTTNQSTWLLTSKNSNETPSPFSNVRQWPRQLIHWPIRVSSVGNTIYLTDVNARPRHQPQSIEYSAPTAIPKSNSYHGRSYHDRHSPLLSYGPRRGPISNASRTPRRVGPHPWPNEHRLTPDNSATQWPWKRLVRPRTRASSTNRSAVGGNRNSRVLRLSLDALARISKCCALFMALPLDLCWAKCTKLLIKCCCDSALFLSICIFYLSLRIYSGHFYLCSILL